MSREQKPKKIFRVEKDRNYTVIKNTIFHDKRISWGAKGVLGYALTKPDDWSLYISEVVKNGSDKKTKVSFYFKELREAGYFELKRIYENGKIAKIEYIISEQASHSEEINIITRHQKRKEQEKLKAVNPIQEKPKQEKLLQENLVIEKPSLLNTNSLLSTELKLNTEKKKEEEIPFPSQSKFDEFKNYHERKLGYKDDAYQVDVLATKLDYSTELYDKILEAKNKSNWAPRRSQPNNAKYLLKAFENESLDTSANNEMSELDKLVLGIK